MSDKPQPNAHDDLEWNDDAYGVVVRTFADIDLDPFDIASLSLDQINEFSSKTYERYGEDRRRYWESLKHFLKIYRDQILEDSERLKRGENIIAPKQRALMIQVVRAIDSCMQRHKEIQQFMVNSEFELSPALQEVIYDSLKGTMNFEIMNRLLISQRPLITQALLLLRKIRLANDKVRSKVNDKLSPFRVNENLTSLKKNLQVFSSKVEIIRSKILSGCEHGLEKVPVPGKGMGVKATRNFAINEYIVEYTGELISEAEGRQRMSKYAKDESFGNFLLSFQSDDKRLFIDATKDDGRLGRWINHSMKNSNANFKVIVIDGKPHVFLMASREILAREEILYDYGERNSDTIKNHPWLLE